MFVMVMNPTEKIFLLRDMEGIYAGAMVGGLRCICCWSSLDGANDHRAVPCSGCGQRHYEDSHIVPTTAQQLPAPLLLHDGVLKVNPAVVAPPGSRIEKGFSDAKETAPPFLAPLVRSGGRGVRPDDVRQAKRRRRAVAQPENTPPGGAAGAVARGRDRADDRDHRGPALHARRLSGDESAALDDPTEAEIAGRREHIAGMLWLGLGVALSGPCMAFWALHDWRALFWGVCAAVALRRGLLITSRADNRGG